MRKETAILSINQAQALTRAAEIIQSGGIIAFPTDTVYGIGVSAFNKNAIEKIYQAKNRSRNKAIPILLGDPDQITKITISPDEMVGKIIQKFWPGALTLILPILPSLPVNLTNTNTIGVRIPDHDQTRELLRQTGPLAATSANLSGEESALTAAQVAENLSGKIDLILDGGKSRGGLASTILDCTSPEPIVLRSGPISINQINDIIT